MAQGYFFAGEDLTEREMRRRLAAAMLARGTQPREVKHWTQGVAQLLDAFQGRMGLDKTAREQEEARARGAAEAAPFVEGLFNQPPAPTSGLAAVPSSVDPDEPQPKGLASPVFDTRRSPDQQPPPARLPDTFDSRRPPALQPTLPGEPYPSVEEREQFHRVMAEREGLNPDAVINILKAEGMQPGTFQSNARNKQGVREPSFGDGQLLIGGPGTGFKRGLGNEALALGIDPRDRDDWQRASQFTMGKMAEQGTAPWFGAKRAGVTDAGLKNLSTQVASAEPHRLGPSDEGQQDVAKIMSLLQNPDVDSTTKELLLEVLKKRMPQPMEWTEIGTDSMGKKTYGFVDKVNRRVFGPDGVTPMGAPSDQQLASTDGLVGEEYLKASGLDENTKATVRSLADYTYDPRFLAIKGNQRQKLFEHAMRLNPELNVADYDTKFKLNREFKGGKYSQSMRAADQIIHHLGSLKGSFAKLNKRSVLGVTGPFGEGDLGPLTATVNKGRGMWLEGEGAPEINEVKANAKAVANELGKLFKGAGATSLQDIQEWEELISSDLTPEQQDSVIRKAIELMAGGIASYRNIYDNGMGSTYVSTRPFESVFRLDKHSREVLHDFNLSENDIGLVSPGGPNFQHAGDGTDKLLDPNEPGITDRERLQRIKKLRGIR